MTVNDLYKTCLAALSQIYSAGEATKITSIIFEHFAGIDRSFIIKFPLSVLDDQVTLAISKVLDELKACKPVQYVTGEAWFYSMKLKVSEAVLIPRPETEELVETIIHSTETGTTAAVLDIGTGSGCIALALKKNLPLAKLTAIDVSDGALEVAAKNAAALHAEINFVQLDFLAEENWKNLGDYDIIVSNPPYIPEAEAENMGKNVTAFEPGLALFVKDYQPLLFYEKIAAFSKKHLTGQGSIFLEVHEDRAEEVATLFQQEGYKTNIKTDISGKERMVIVTRYR